MGLRGGSRTGAKPKSQISNFKFQISDLTSNTAPAPFFGGFRTNHNRQHTTDYGRLTTDN